MFEFLRKFNVGIFVGDMDRFISLVLDGRGRVDVRSDNCDGFNEVTSLEDVGLLVDFFPNVGVTLVVNGVAWPLHFCLLPEVGVVCREDVGVLFPLFIIFPPNVGVVDLLMSGVDAATGFPILFRFYKIK